MTDVTPPTTTAAVDTAANDVRKDVENDVKGEATGIIAHVELYAEEAEEFGEKELSALKAWAEAGLAKLKAI